MKFVHWACGCGFEVSLFSGEIYNVHVCSEHSKDPVIQTALTLITNQLSQLISTKAAVNIAGCAPG